jgi:hypothetical protein
MAQTSPEDPDIYWQITVKAPFADSNVVFLPGHMYRVRQVVYDALRADAACGPCIDTATLLPDTQPV